MAVAITIILVIFIICATILITIYMYYCGENGIRMFADPQYEERISRLEKLIETEEKKK